MKTWLHPIARAIDLRPAPLEIFLRDDDGGWDDGRLATLLDLCDRLSCPIDLALIPAAVSDRLMAALARRLARGASIGLHQHGFTHRNHETVGRPCEFGPSRSAVAHYADIAEGRRLLAEQFGPALDPIFTPPWNRCTSATTSALKRLGFLAISRDGRGGLGGNDLIECPIGVDWFWRVKGIRLSRDEWAERVAALILDADAPLGIMLHHAQMGADDFRALGGVMELFARSGLVRGLRMREVVGALQASVESGS